MSPTARAAGSLWARRGEGGGLAALAVAVKKQASFWKFTGIAVAVRIGIYIVAIVIAVVAGVAAGLSH